MLHTHPALFPELPGWARAGTRKVKPIWIWLKQETVSGSGISWGICKSAPRSRQTTMPAPHHSSFLQAGCPSCRPANSVKALKEHNNLIIYVNCHTINTVAYTSLCSATAQPENVALPTAFAQRCCSNPSIYPAACSGNAARLLLWAHAGTDRQTKRRTERQTDTVPFHRPSCTHYAGNANKLWKS